MCPMKLDVRALLAGESRSLPIDILLPFSADSQDTKTTIGDFTFDGPITVKGEILNTAGYLRLTATLEAAYTTFCARCLDEVKGVFSFPFERTVSTRKQLSDLPEEALDDYVLADDGYIVLDDLLLEFFELSLPLRTLCREDCLGLCHHCGKNLNQGACDCASTEVDPRLAPLQKWLAEHKEEE